MSGIIVKKQDDVIVAISGAQRLEIEIANNGFASATLISGRDIVVVKNNNGDLIGKTKH